MEIYIASLTDYNNGILHGSWFRPADYSDAEELMEAIQEKVLATSPTAQKYPDEIAEEWAIHDYSDAPDIGLGEYEDLERIVEIAQGLDEHGDMFRAYLEEIDSNGTPQHAHDCYHGEYDSEEDFAEQFIRECYEIPDHLEYYIDWEKFARDLFMSDFTFADGHVFSNY